MSAPSRRLTLAPGTRRDLADVLLFTELRWGKRQRQVYRAALMEAMHGLVRFPSLGHSRDDVSLGLRGRPVREHMVYYRISDRAMVVVRILHAKMDAARELSEP